MAVEFNYPDMTPALAVYLGFDEPRPGYEYLAPNSGTPTQESKARVDAWQAKIQLLKDNLSQGEFDAYKNALKTWYCRDETQIGAPQAIWSPSKRWCLAVTDHFTKAGAWHYTKARIYDGGGKLLQTVCRNYHSFGHLFVEDHPKGAFLVCGSDYQGQTVVDLNTGERADFLPETAEQGSGFCWVSYSASPSKQTLAVHGCYWACPYEVWFVDFTDPMSLPLPVLHRDSDAEEFFGWGEDAPDTASIGRSWEVYMPDGKREAEMTDADWEAASRREKDSNTGIWEKRSETTTWTRPQQGTTTAP